jgi:hypothetical protein
MVTGKLTLPEAVIGVAVGAPMLNTGAVKSAELARVAVLVLPAASVTVVLRLNEPSV